MKPFDTSGPAIRTTKSIALRRYSPDRLPDPGDVLDCLVVINDRGDGIARGRPALADGASFAELAYLADVQALRAEVETLRQEIANRPPVATPVTDLAAHMRQAINEAMPVLVHRAQQPVIEAGPQHDSAEIARLKEHMRELTAAVADAYEALETLSADVAEIEQTALADVAIVKG